MGNKFDLDAARKHADTGGLMNTTKWLHAALDEIERLQDREQQLMLDVNRNHKEAMTYKAAYDKQAARIKELERYLKEERAQNLLNFQRHDEGEKRSWNDLSELERMARIEFAGTCLEAEGKIGGGDKE